MKWCLLVYFRSHFINEFVYFISGKMSTCWTCFIMQSFSRFSSTFLSSSSVLSFVHVFIIIVSVVFRPRFYHHRQCCLRLHRWHSLFHLRTKQTFVLDSNVLFSDFFSGGHQFSQIYQRFFSWRCQLARFPRPSRFRYYDEYRSRFQWHIVE